MLQYPCQSNRKRKFKISDENVTSGSITDNSSRGTQENNRPMLCATNYMPQNKNIYTSSYRNQSLHHRLQKRSSVTMKILIIVIVTSLLCCDVTAIPIDFNNVSESETESRGNVEEKPTSSFTLEDVELSAKEFLAKFGYVKPADWNNVAPKFFEEDGLGISEGEGSDYRKESYDGSGVPDENDKDSHLVDFAFDEISEAQYHRALIKYQRVNGLTATGMLDNYTTAYMGRPRCGVPDRTAVLKVNRTYDIIDIKSTMTTVATISESTTTGNTLNNATTGAWVTTNTTKTPTIHTVTGISDFGSGEDESQEISTPGSGEDQQELQRKKRQITAGFDMDEKAFEDDLFEDPLGEDFDIDEIRARQMEFTNMHDGPILEAELPNDPRVDELKGILEVLRQEKLLKLNASKRNEIYNDVVSAIRPRPVAPLPRLVSRIVMETRAERRKRSILFSSKTNGWLMAFPKKVITWRLVDEWPTTRTFMIEKEIWFTVRLAFRMWSEVLPRNFREDTTSPMTNVDILLGFGKQVHNRCQVPFYNGKFTREYAHAWPLPQAEVHFNDDQPFVSVSWEPSPDVGLSNSALSVLENPISLLKVATHEIGHALGLPHSNNTRSVMHAVYTPYQSKGIIELKEVDRQAIQKVYGKCDLAFDAVFDWVRKYYTRDGSPGWKYNTFFFRSSWYWLYENRGRRPRYGDPKYSGYDSWREVINGANHHRKIDGVVHIRDWSDPEGLIFFFTGDTFTEYDSYLDRVKVKDSEGRFYPRKIRDGFPQIPYPIDTVFYHMTEKMMYFFKDRYVYKFKWNKKVGKLISIQEISTTFPGWGGAPPLPNNIDAAYYSYTDAAYYFFKGIYFWKMADERERYYNKGLRIPDKAVSPKRYITSKWHYICDVDPTEMTMSLPPETTTFNRR